jgi:hypothetical protein
MTREAGNPKKKTNPTKGGKASARYLSVMGQMADSDAKCRFFEDGNVRIEKMIGRILEEDDVEERKSKIYGLLSMVSKFVDCEDDDGGYSECAYCKVINSWRKSAVEAYIPIDLTLINLTHKLENVAEALEKY